MKNHSARAAGCCRDAGKAGKARGKREPDGVSGAEGAVQGVERGKKREARGAIEDGGVRR